MFLDTPLGTLQHPFVGAPNTKAIQSHWVIWHQFLRSTSNDSSTKRRSRGADKQVFWAVLPPVFKQSKLVQQSNRCIFEQRKYPTSCEGSTSSCCSSTSSGTRRRDWRNDFFRFFQNFFSFRPTFRERNRRLRSATIWTVNSAVSSATSPLPASSCFHCSPSYAAPEC